MLLDWGVLFEGITVNGQELVNIDTMYFVDFDNGQAANNAIASLPGGNPDSSLGSPFLEGLAVRGDSGSPYIVNRNGVSYIAALVSGDLPYDRFLATNPDIDTKKANDSFGEIDIAVNLSTQSIRQWIDDVAYQTSYWQPGGGGGIFDFSAGSNWSTGSSPSGGRSGRIDISNSSPLFVNAPQAGQVGSQLTTLYMGGSSGAKYLIFDQAADSIEATGSIELEHNGLVLLGGGQIITPSLVLDGRDGQGSADLPAAFIWDNTIANTLLDVTKITIGPSGLFRAGSNINFPATVVIDEIDIQPGGQADVLGGQFPVATSVLNEGILNLSSQFNGGFAIDNTLDITAGSFSQFTDGLVQMEFYKPTIASPVFSDRINASTQANLAGALALDPDKLTTDGDPTFFQNAKFGDTFTIVTSGQVNGAFETVGQINSSGSFVTGTALPDPIDDLGASYAVTYTGTSVQVMVALTGDANLSGQIEQGDLDAVLLNWGQTGRTWGTGEMSGNGQVEQSDLDGILLNWGVSTSYGTGSEPSLVSAPDDLGLDLVVNEVTGEVRIVGEGNIVSVVVESFDDSLAGSDPQVTWFDDSTVLMESAEAAIFINVFGADASDGLALGHLIDTGPGGTDLSRLSFTYTLDNSLTTLATSSDGLATTTRSFTLGTGSIIVVPEPAALALLALGLPALMHPRPRPRKFARSVPRNIPRPGLPRPGQQTHHRHHQRTHQHRPCRHRLLPRSHHETPTPTPT